MTTRCARPCGQPPNGSSSSSGVETRRQRLPSPSLSCTGQWTTTLSWTQQQQAATCATTPASPLLQVRGR